MRHSSENKGRKKEGNVSKKNFSVERYISQMFNNTIPKHIKMDNYDMNSQDELGNSPLHVAVRHGHMKCAYLFLKAGADVNVNRIDGYSVLHTAAANGYTDLIRSLIEKGAVVNARTNDNETPLHCAVTSSKADSTQVLLKHGASINATFGKMGMTALHIAVTQSPNCIGPLLNASANIFAMNRDGICPLELAMGIDVNRFLKLYPENSNLTSENGITALHIASRCLNCECLGMLISSGYDVNVITNKGDTPLHYSCLMEKFINYETALNHVELSVIRSIELLLHAGANINTKNNAGFTPLLLSVKHNLTIATRHLLIRGANVNISGGKRNRTALHVASQNGNLSFIKFILESGADKLVVDAHNNTALMLAAKKSHFECVKHLLQNDVPLWSIG